MNALPRAAWTPARVTAGTAVLATLVTLGVSVLPFTRFAYRSPSAHLVIETAAGVTALIVAYLAAWRFRRRPRWDGLLLVTALVVLAGTNLGLSLLPELIDAGPAEFVTWSSLVGGFIASGVLAAAAFVPARVSLLVRAGLPWWSFSPPWPLWWRRPSWSGLCARTYHRRSIRGCLPRARRDRGSSGPPACWCSR
jgi:hypothetical protein